MQLRRRHPAQRRVVVRLGLPADQADLVGPQRRRRIDHDVVAQTRANLHSDAEFLGEFADQRRGFGLTRGNLAARQLPTTGQLRAKTVLELGERYPGDAGVLAALLLNRITLGPGEGIFLSAGNLHAYLRGVGLEVMANSDNVLRGGLTPKHVDVPELLRVLNFNPTTESQLRADTHPAGLASFYDTPTAEFAASMLTLDADQVGHEVDAPSRHDGPQILLCIEGATSVHGKAGALTLTRGA